MVLIEIFLKIMQKFEKGVYKIYLSGIILCSLINSSDKYLHIIITYLISVNIQNYN
jgi:hypothetical protein